MNFPFLRKGETEVWEDFGIRENVKKMPNLF
jgi:hypothetical protein